MNGRITGNYRAQLYSDLIHAGVVILVVVAASILAVLDRTYLPPDVLGTVYGGAIGYAAGRAGNLSRSVDHPTEPS